MHAVSKIDNPFWQQDKNLETLMNVLNAGAQVPAARIVGGAVRNALLGRASKDVDIATILGTDKVITLIEAAGLKHASVGLEHGTVLVIVNSTPYEVTTLRRDVETDGRRAKIEATDDWFEDASRRDFTVNAFYADYDGTLYDPCGGLADIKPLVFRFIGDPAQRIREDYLRILRFFRFYAEYGDGAFEPAGLAACLEHRAEIQTLSVERIREEFLKILGGAHGRDILAFLDGKGFVEFVVASPWDMPLFQTLCDVEKIYGMKDPIRRLYALCHQSWDDVAANLKLSNKEANRFEEFGRVEGFVENWPRYAYRFGKQRAIDQFLLFYPQSSDLLDAISWWEKPLFPVGGKDVRAHGVDDGPEMGRMLKQMEAWWVEAGFKPSKADILKKFF